jgi:beta-glucanase (GH16 family)
MACDGGSTVPVEAGGTPATSGGATGNIGGGGTSASVGGANAEAGAPPVSGNFVLAWEDNFDTLDSSLWALQTFTWDGNLAQFSTTNASVANGTLKIALTAAPTGAAKPYLGVEARSTKTLTYGKVSARMRFASGSAVVSGLVLFYTPWPNCDWNEIDIEHLGKTPTSSQLNAMVFTGTYNPSCTTSVSPVQEPLMASLGFDAEADFHQYDIEWTPAGVKYVADGALLRTWTTNIALLKRPLNILLTIWASNAPSWAGAVDATTAPTSAEVDWIKVYDYK